ncbi:helix-turn-helix domain-containing protein [Streptomyces qinzhouensis]|uniref:Helix-turn-helix domain-containing protein n=1 Tax=Streptomyces qinzhouensis TaxID=2599401 RepID=A0A5B8JK37_9ACTN|nr:helix-turn-helix domain-containing protein [Streptomyces qinzhouensis]
MAAFLRSRRARVTPADVGMPPGLRRRTPGLRREEVAQLSGVGVTWYTWLEQGRPINASPQVLNAVARTLRLDASEREHLYHLAKVPYEQRPGADVDEDSGGVGPEIRSILDALDPRPAVVYNSRYDVLATNRSYDRLFRTDLFQGPGRKNALWTLFAAADKDDCPMRHPEVELPLMVAQFRAAYGRHVGDPVWESFVRELSRSSEYFAELWRSGNVVHPGPRVKVFRHPGVGEMRWSSVSMEINGLPECRMVVYSPGDEESARRLDTLPRL